MLKVSIADVVKSNILRMRFFGAMEENSVKKVENEISTTDFMHGGKLKNLKKSHKKWKLFSQISSMSNSHRIFSI